ncbi:MAG: MBL fold metallo-hydrolase [Candidatus Abyssobacteria bacterium SURF_17]|uniref:MBL fold metallo-hydrolase n=1 Tax=Candidatus Abyssobacteria bacterium SURF_17 TaxID=2093361 RepID=A0A419F8J0_9BACT|nr:MAG: MBL fold metallo-hydrolase [Candidatus Abyssubacteria bacterium SURF_17]
MKTEVKVVDGVYWVGAVDWNVRYFHGYTYTTPRGTTYNAYLIQDEKVALVDTVYAAFTGEMMDRIRALVDPEKIDYIIANHVETDHSGALAAMLKAAKNAKLVCNQRCKDGLEKNYFGNWDYSIVKTGDTIKLGKKTLTFLEAPMLHWPDSMFTYIPEDELLLPNDAFGQHLASTERFVEDYDEAIVMQEAAKYYANILMPMSPLITKKIEEVGKMNLKIRMIAPSHGLIWREPQKIVNAYLRWASGEADKAVLVAYDTMWTATEKMALSIVEGIRSEGVPAKLVRIPVSDRSDAIADCLLMKGILVGSSTINRGMLPSLSPFLEDLKGLRPRKKVGAAFGSFGWSGGGAESVDKILREAGVEISAEPLTVKYMPNAEELKKCFEFGRAMAQKVKA